MGQKTKAMAVLSLFLLLGWYGPLPAWSMEPAKAMRVVILFDTSGSMRQSDPQNLSRTAVQLFLDLARPQDALGLVAFSDRAVPLVSLTPLSSPGIRQLFLSHLRALSFTGQTTDLGAALERGLDSFPPKSAGTSRDLVLLLTDGNLDLGPSRRAEEPIALARMRQKTLPEYRRRGVALYTIAFTESADQKLLQEMAQATEGEFRFIPQATILHKAFGQLFILANQAESLPMQQGTFLIDEHIQDTSLIISKRHPQAQIALGTPRGQTLYAGSPHAGVTWRSTPSYDVVHLVKPEAGTWQVKGSQGTEENIAIVGTNTLGLQVELRPAYAEVEAPLNITAFLHQEGQKEHHLQEGVSFHADIATPGGETFTLPLRAQEDGVFGATLTTLREPGKYDLVITATAANLRRQRSFSFIVHPSCFQPTVITQAPITASVTLADTCPRFLDLLLESGLSTERGATTWIPLVSSPQGIYQATIAGPSIGQTGEVMIRISGRLQGGEAFTLMKGPWPLPLPAPPPPAIPQQDEKVQGIPQRDESSNLRFAQTKSSQAQHILILIILSMLVGNGALGFFLWRARQAYQQLQGEMHQGQQVHEPSQHEVVQLPPDSAYVVTDEQRKQMNTSIQYVTDNLVFLQDAFTDLVPLLEQYAILLRAVKDTTVTEELIGEIETLAEQTNIDYMLAECPQAFQQALEGIKSVTSTATRIRNVV